ncbi:MAG: hypothetical protein MJ198_06805 [Bacteroidales bacterium]|nr:hypothetical protein [Bacteroidales bacterium]
MPTKEEIFDNISDYQATEIADFIIDGIVTFDELCEYKNTGGEFGNVLREEVKKLIAGQEPKDWDAAVRANTEESYSEYVRKYPLGPNRIEANVRIGKIRTQKNDNLRWQATDKKNIEDVKKYLAEYPEGRFAYEAKKLMKEAERRAQFDLGEFINELRMKKENEHFSEVEKLIKDGLVSNTEILKIIEEDHNLFNTDCINELLDNQYITYEDLISKVHIDETFIHSLQKNLSNIDIPSVDCDAVQQIEKKSTEIYFWGVKNSGKSCAIGSILNTARRMGYGITNKKGQGIPYFDALSDLFNQHDSRPTSVLPNGTPTDSFAEMGFDMTMASGKYYPLTFVDLAGELLTAIYAEAHNIVLDDPAYDKAAKAFRRVLLDNHKEGNRKIHFFVIEYGAAGKKIKIGNDIELGQDALLENVIDILNVEDPKENPFKRDTDAIYVVLTKADKIKADSAAERREKANEYVKNHYKGLVTAVRNVCRECELNGYVKPIAGKEAVKPKILVIPFSIGEVCFKSYCNLKEDAPQKILNEIVARATFEEDDQRFLSKLKKNFRK